MANSGSPAGTLGTVSAVFFTKKDADNAYNALLKRGHTPDDISVLKSDETLNKPEDQVVQTSDDQGEPEPAIRTTSDVIADTIVSITSMISLPGLGIAISKTLFKRIPIKRPGKANTEIADKEYSKAKAEKADPAGLSMKEGGIIVSVDPRNFEEKNAIIKDFHDNNGHDILGDDGYTELD
ncbi:hypothetical protein L0657_25915 [Dyadobacter sp. CY345]|uniref:hypothetical protein n=1 Tax=Dyadobacter sp. CY345 TaxID=2909335 RepID=UPI001F35EF24|nr:hypothetical protein [Dyadobacter sp. CY345]MCF2447417.1 hypothetical protein [Dyadobacter sp. CY345]